jgi:ADP-heptose:LPS heptosyltransferase
LGIGVHLLLEADYPETASLFQDWTVVRSVANRVSRGSVTHASYDYLIPAVPPFYWPRVAHLYSTAPSVSAGDPERGGQRRALPRPESSLFYRNEQEFYLSFAWQLGFPAARRIFPFLPIAPAAEDGITASTVVLAPGCKTGEMALKRWPWFAELASRLPDVAIVGTKDDLFSAEGRPLAIPDHVRNYAGRLSLRQTAELLAGAGIVVGNDSGLSHLAAAVGVPTVMIFGPTPHIELGPMPPHVRILRAGLPCEPCWHGDRFAACRKNLDCLRQVSVDHVIREIEDSGVPVL